MAGYTHPRVGTYGRRRGGSGPGFSYTPRPKSERDDEWPIGDPDPNVTGRERYLGQRMGAAQPPASAQERARMLQTAAAGYDSLDAGEKKRLAEGRAPSTLDSTRGQGYRGMGKPSGLVSGDGAPMPTMAQRNEAAAAKGFPELGASARPGFYGKVGQSAGPAVLPVPAAAETATGDVGQPGVRVVPVNPARGGGTVVAQQMDPDTPSSTRGATGEFVGPDEAARRARVADTQMQAQRVADARGNLNAANGAAMAPTAMTMQRPAAEPTGSDFPISSPTPNLDALRADPDREQERREFGGYDGDETARQEFANSLTPPSAGTSRPSGTIIGRAKEAVAEAKGTFGEVTGSLRRLGRGIGEIFGGSTKPADPITQTGATIDRGEQRRRQASAGYPTGLDTPER